MALLTNRPKGTKDMLPADSHRWQTVEQVARDTARAFGFREIRFPTFEHTELFTRSVGATTDVVQKEMYTFSDKGNRSITLRPEGTAGVVRAALENGLLNEALPQKFWYLTSAFRYENVQTGRLREFHQFGVELFGSASPYADADMIILGKTVLKRLNLQNLTLHINSIGCPVCRTNYQQALREYFAKRENELCDTCKTRLERNPMRILDCKSPVCGEIAKDAPLILDYLCEECNAHFTSLKKLLDNRRIVYTVNPKIVRGLDYYTKTVFEFISNELGAQGTVCAGGRYDGLVEELGGKAMPGLGFAMGLERLIMLMEKQNAAFLPEETCDLYIATMGEQALEKAAELAVLLRDEGFCAEYDLMERGFKAQMKYADKIAARFVMVLGENELSDNEAEIKNKEGQRVKTKLDGSIIDVLSNLVLDDVLAEESTLRDALTQALEKMPSAGQNTL